MSTPNPEELLASLIRFDTSNPPGNERECIAYIERLVGEAGLETKTCAAQDDRPNLIARLPGRGEAPPLLLYGHVDVVPADPSEWRHPPFDGHLENGYVWGRGAVDMKGGVAMMVSALLGAAQAQAPPRGDIIFMALSDEEAGGHCGARFLVEHHPELFTGVRHAIGEFGGYTMHLLGRRFYPIQVAEKRSCQVRATLRGAGGHASIPRRGEATARLGGLLRQLDRRRLPVHITAVARRMIEGLADGLPPPAGAGLRQLLKPALTDALLRVAPGPTELLDALLHNTAVPTIIQAGAKDNVIPSQASVHIDGRLLPDQRPEDFLRELRTVVGDEVELEVLGYDGGKPDVDYGLFDLLSEILVGLDQGATPIPMLLPAITDGRFLERLGIQTYGYTPLRLDPDFNFTETVHAADERVPVAGLEFGTRALSELLARYGTG